MGNMALRQYFGTCWSIELRSSLIIERARAKEEASSSSSEMKHIGILQEEPQTL